MTKTAILLTGLSTIFSLVSVKPSQDTDFYPNSCTGLSDGIHYMKLLDGDDSEYPVIKALCNNEFMILNAEIDFNILKYFSSYDFWHKYSIGPTSEDHSNWNSWYLPSLNNDNSMNYLLSPDCLTCDDSHTRQIYKTDSAYWMTGTLFGCMWPVKGNHNCDIDWDTDDCYACIHGVDDISSENTKIVDGDTNDTHYFDSTGICTHNVRPSYYEVETIHDNCARQAGNWFHLIPSLGTKGKYCVCVQPTTDTQFFEGEIKIIDENENENDENDEDDETETVNIQLYQEDFEKGTYRITKSGTYTIMENIEFNFGHENYDEDHPNQYGSYMPTTDDVDDYPGAGEYKNPYFMGWFAGITIETDDVTLDLNGFELKMNEIFYYQQRWFTVIEVGSQYFLPGQGIGNFGALPATPNNIIIKNGILGLSSHHGIHGNHNKDVYIQDLTVREFETHGIQLNGFDNINIKNVDIGPTSQKAYFNGAYGHARFVLQRYRYIAEESNGEYVEFYGRNKKTSMQDIVDELEKQMNFAFWFVVSKFNFLINDKNNPDYESFKSAIKLFINPYIIESISSLVIKNNNRNINTYTNNKIAIPNPSAQYGIFLNTFGASVFTYNLFTHEFSNNAILSNIKIHGMEHSMKEYVGLGRADTGEILINPFNAGIDIESVFGVNINDWDNTFNPINFDNYDNLDSKDDEDTIRNNIDINYDYENENLELLSYKGDILTDAYIASNRLSNNFGYLQSQVVTNEYLCAFAFGENSHAFENILLLFLNADAMFHSGKGTQGLRIDGVTNVNIENIEIYDNHDYTPLGKNYNYGISYYKILLDDDTMNEFEPNLLKVTFAPHPRQTEPMQIGFSGNINQGININAADNVYMKNINVHDLTSSTGPVYGIAVWPSCNVIFDDEINVTNVFAGTNLEPDTFTYDDYPNKMPEVCGVRIYEEYNEYTTTSIINPDTIFTSKCFLGETGCFGNFDSLHQYLSYEEVGECDNEEEIGQIAHFDGFIDITNMFEIKNPLKDVEQVAESDEEEYNIASIKLSKYFDIGLLCMIFLIFIVAFTVKYFVSSQKQFKYTPIPN